MKQTSVIKKTYKKIEKLKILQRTVKTMPNDQLDQKKSQLKCLGSSLASEAQAVAPGLQAVAPGLQSLGPWEVKGGPKNMLFF